LLLQEHDLTKQETRKRFVQHQSLYFSLMELQAWNSNAKKFKKWSRAKKFSLRFQCLAQNYGGEKQLF
jgi:hypothetical protein